MPLSQPILGNNTATPLNLTYRVGRIAPYLSGRWLDYGCAEGGYAEALLNHGVNSVVGVDVEEGRIEQAAARSIPNASFYAFNGYNLEFPDDSFDGAFVNEVLEHVADEQASLREIYRPSSEGTSNPDQSKPVVPFEGHGSIMGAEFLFQPHLFPGCPSD